MYIFCENANTISKMGMPRLAIFRKFALENWRRLQQPFLTTALLERHQKSGKDYQSTETTIGKS